MSQSNNKTIAKNTLFLYFRMMFTMLVSLYTSRVVLQVLGVDDYGIYQAVGGIVGFLSFINGALSTGTSRFLTYELGTGNYEKLKRTFSTTLNIHIALAVLIVLIAETIGLWFLYNKMVIPIEKQEAAIYVYHISILTAVLTLTQVPYNASIISHERMSVFAYASIVEVVAKLLVVYLLNIGNFDKLKLYATLLFVVQFVLMLFYRIYCTRNFKETKYSFVYDKSILKSIASFSGWSLIANASYALNSQGILLLLNMFFSPAVVTARAISIQVNMAANQFINNIRTAVNPQIVKLYATKDYNNSKKLLLQSTKICYFLMLIIGLPIIIAAEPLLSLWLDTVPKYTVIFLQLIIIQSLIQVFDTSLYTALYAKGQLKENALLSPTLGLLRFPIIYIFFKFGYSPVTLSWASIISYSLLAFVIKPLLIIKIVDYKWNEIFSVYKSCLFVTILAIPIPFIVYKYLLNQYSDIVKLILILLISTIITLVIIWKVGIDRKTRIKLRDIIVNKYLRCLKNI